jgi:hypothetical protein
MVKIKVVKYKSRYLHKAVYTCYKYFIQLRRAVAEKFLGLDLQVRVFNGKIIIEPKNSRTIDEILSESLEGKDLRREKRALDGAEKA